MNASETTNEIIRITNSSQTTGRCFTAAANYFSSWHNYSRLIKKKIMATGIFFGILLIVALTAFLVVRKKDKGEM
jgi:hypothetical protein